jgi:hypothetical protein
MEGVSPPLQIHGRRIDSLKGSADATLFFKGSERVRV